MAGIVGIARQGEKRLISNMLDILEHRGGAGRNIIEWENATVGIVWNESENRLNEELRALDRVIDGSGHGRFAEARLINGELFLKRDELGVAPLYYGYDTRGALCFASEVKSLVLVTMDVHEFPPATEYLGGRITKHFTLERENPLSESPDQIARELRRRLEESVQRCIHHDTIGSWLSGGLDSSTLAACARRHVRVLHTFAGGFRDAPDLEFAREVANFIKSDHHEVVLQLNDLLRALPDVIYHLESFDALLVRSSITNYLVAKAASDYTAEVFSGECGDELFAGYSYLKSLPRERLDDELIDITARLHNTAFQRVDRSASAHGTTAYVVFADPEVFRFALSIPIGYKLNDGVEKWILRRAIEDALPVQVVHRPKAKFWEGAGVQEVLARYAEEHVSDGDFSRERVLTNGWELNTKEELLYYRVFVDRFGGDLDLSWMGRTKGAPRE